MKCHMRYLTTMILEHHIYLRKEIKTMDGIEKIAFENVKEGFDYIVGGWYNCVQDDYLEGIPDTMKEAKNEIYFNVMENKYEPGCEMYGRAPREMRFAGEKFIRERIDELFETDGDIACIAEEKGW